MKIVITIGHNSNDCETQKMTIDGRESLSVYPLSECPEDAILERSLVTCEDVVKFMKQAYEAGEKGEGFSFEIQSA
jgi:hypothetical protein